MKRTSMTAAILAGIAGVAGISNMANAVYLNPDGLGSVLVYPYYTVNGGNATLISVVNTTDEGKAIKVRFLEAYNSREVLDFNLYMSPFDVWVAAVAPTATGAQILTNDNSCTVPPIPATGVAFRTGAFDGSISSQPKDGGPTSLVRTREGYVELIEMGTVTNESASTLNAITHGSSGVPSSCNQVVKAWSGGGYWATQSALIDITDPDGGLFGSGSIINVAEGTIAAYNAEAIDAFYAAATTATHTAPGSLAPSIKSATNTTSNVFANGALVTTAYTDGINAVSSLFMVDNVYNEYNVQGSTNTSTEWVITFPTKRFYVDKPNLYAGTAALKPFDVLFSSANGGTSCSPVGLQFWNREEATTTTGVDFSPAPTAAGTALCWEAQVVTFSEDGLSATPNASAPSTVLGSVLTANIDTAAVGFDAGWARIDFRNDSTGAPDYNHELPIAAEVAAATPGTPTTQAGNVFLGLPATGFSVVEYVNGNINGALANYTGLYRHKFHRTCTNAGGACS
jgi:hypothetical protein